MKTITAVILLLGFLAAPPTRAADPQELVTLREKYLEALKGVREPIKDKYLNQMNEMLASLTKEGNLQEALAVRDAIRTLETPTPKVEPPTVVTNDEDNPRRPRLDDADDPPPAGTITLRTEDATLEGALKLYRGNIVYWIRPNCRARWLNRDVPAGKYDIYFVYSADYGMGGVVEVRDFGYSFDVNIARTTYGSEARVKVGSIECRGGIGIQITSKTTSKDGVMNLRAVQLVPTT